MTKSRVVGLFLVASAALSARSVFAFHVPEHVSITNRAVEQLRKCGLLPAEWQDNWTRSVVSADEDEDYNLIRKWAHYSHYYNPYHQLDQWRADSSVTIKESVEEIEAAPHDILSVNQLIGRIIHHVQDSSVPAHAVPVSHANQDGFEVADLSAYYQEPLSPADCSHIQPTEPMKALHDNAVETLESLGAHVVFSRDGSTEEQTWLDSFWKLGEGNSFGEYGLLGNAFGEPRFRLPDGTIVSVSREQYTRFKRARVEAAVKATEAVILWANRVRGL